MKRIGNLWEKIISIENLELADKKARLGKQDTYGVKLHDKNREENIKKLHEQLKNKTYKTSPYKIFKIYEPKERIIYRLPYYPDRIVHHAIMNVLEPIWVKTFTYNTYSCIKKRGIHACANQVDKNIAKYNKSDKKLYCLKIDITKFYPSIDHNILKNIIRKKIKDKDLLWLLDEIIDSAPGLPIGNYLSQYLANLYLTYFMHWVNEVLKIDAVEYADDIVFFSDNKEKLHNIFLKIKKYLNTELKLEIKENNQIFPLSKNKYDNHGRALDFVGYKFYTNQKLLRKKIKQNLCRKISKLNIETITYKQLKIELAPWLGWVKYSDSRNLIKKEIKNKQYYDLLKRETFNIRKSRRWKYTLQFQH